MRVPTVYFREKLNALTRKIETIEEQEGGTTPQDLNHIALMADAIRAEAEYLERELRSLMRGANT